MELNISAESRFLDWDYDYGYMWQDEFFWGGQFFPSYSDAQLRAMFAKAGKDMDIYVDAISKLLVNESLWDDGSEESSSRIEHALCSPVYDILALGAAYSSGWPVDYRDGLLEFCEESAYAENITLKFFSGDFLLRRSPPVPFLVLRRGGVLLAKGFGAVRNGRPVAGVRGPGGGSVGGARKVRSARLYGRQLLVLAPSAL